MSSLKSEIYSEPCSFPCKRTESQQSTIVIAGDFYQFALFEIINLFTNDYMGIKLDTQRYQIISLSLNNLRLLGINILFMCQGQPCRIRTTKIAQEASIKAVISTCFWSFTGHWFINTLRPRQNGRHFADDTFKPIFLNENIRISIKISLKFVPKVPINNISALVQIMAWRPPGDKPLSEPMMVCLLTHICVTRPQWVNKTPSYEYSNPHYQSKTSQFYNGNPYTNKTVLV